MAVQMNYIGRDATLEFGILGVKGKVKQVLFGDVRPGLDGSPRFFTGRTDIAAVILEHTDAEDKAPLVSAHMRPLVALTSGSEL